MIVPFYQLDDRLFEELCADIVRHHFPSCSVDLYGRKGQKQYAVDIIAVSPNRVYAIQCKCYKEFSAAKFREEVDYFLESKERWEKYGISDYVICLAHEVSDTGLVEEFLKSRVRLRELKIELSLWSAGTIQGMLSDSPTLTRKYIKSPSWKAVLLGYEDEDQIFDDVLSSRDKEIVRWLNTSAFSELFRYCESKRRSGELPEEVFCSVVEKSGEVLRRSAVPLEEQLQLAIILLQQPKIVTVWQTRRLLGKAIAKVVKQLLADNSESSKMQSLFENCLGSDDKMILLATAYTANIKAPRAFGKDVGRHLFHYSHPQVRWLFARRWPVIKSAFRGKDIEIKIEDAARENDSWLRRRWFLAFVQDLVSSKSSEREISAILSDLDARESGTLVGENFVSTLKRWLILETNYSFQRSGTRDKLLQLPCDDITKVLNVLRLEKSDIGACSIAQIIDLECLKLDVRDDDSTKRIEGEGRYGIIHSWVTDLLRLVKKDELSALLVELANSSDEGVRLSVAKNGAKWMVRLDDDGLAREVLSALLQDENGWVFRESLTMLMNLEYSLEEDLFETLRGRSMGTLMRLLEAGWPLPEFRAAGQWLMAGVSKGVGRK